MGEVFLAHDTSLDRQVAIKFLPDPLNWDETARKRFVREARSAAALDHPYICGIHEVGEAGGKSFIVMEYLEGQTLKNRLEQGVVPLKEAMHWASEIAEALVAAHEKGIIHRDLKPANIMLLRTGHAKVMDFGLAKQVSLSGPLGSQEDTLTGALTREGTTVGTLPYMSPEQVQGKVLDFRSDLFSFGIMLYEMLTGINPFKKASGFDTADSILRETPAPASDLRGDVPALLNNTISKLLAKKPEDRYQSIREASADLQTAIDETFGQQTVYAPAASGIIRKALKKPVYSIPLVLLLATAAYFLFQGVQRYQKIRWANETVPVEVERLMEQGRPVAAARLLRTAQPYAPDSKELNRLKTGLYQGAMLTIKTTPPGADIYYRDYADVKDDDPSSWEWLGRSPFSANALIGFHRFRLVKEGLVPVEFAAGESTNQLRLHPTDAISPGMVEASGFGRGGAFPVAAPINSDEFWIDKYEVTNRQFKEFVDKGGYQKRDYWKHPIMKEGRTIPWESAMSAFRDPTGRPGPSTWEFGSYPEGKGEFPVGGISWYEAAAYAEFAGKSLPTVYHWFHAANIGISGDILRFSNFSGKGAARIGEYRGLGRFGTYDMAGNMKEWCWDGTDDRQYILGGAWNEPDYQFLFPDARRPFDRDATYGFRCVRYQSPVSEALLAPVPANAFASVDRRQDKPADDQAYRIYANLHSYEKTPLKPALESVDENSSQYWRREKVTFQAAYGKERVIADLYLPKNTSPPYQVVLYFPGAGAIVQKTLAGLDFLPIAFILRSGRALMVPAYKGTLERGPSPFGRWDSETLLHWSKDLGRSIDYLETRPEIDVGKLAFFGFSLGAWVGPRLIAVEPRIKVMVLAAGGSSGKTFAEVDPWNFASRVQIPVLMLNGRGDFLFPLETSQQPLFRLLGTPAPDKKHVIYDGGHDIFGRLEVFKDTQDWLDRYLGPVKMKPAS
jgi:eukaryotic-like serine/threonine-protein kinase